MFYIQQKVHHEFIGPKDLELLIIEVIQTDPENEENNKYKCRYFSNGQYHTDVFYGFELVEA